MRLLVATAGILAVLSPAAAFAASAGGAGYAGNAAGGSAYGGPVTTVRPVVSLFRVSTRVREGRMPVVRFRIDEPAVRRLSARVAIVPLGRREAVASVRWRRLATGRVVRVRWKRGTRLRPGRYHVRLHATDPYGRTLQRRARQSGKAILTVVPKPKPKPKPKPPPPPPAPAPPPPPPPAPVPLAVPAPTTAGVFPVQGPHSYGGDGSRFGAARNGHVHQGQDVSAAAGTPVVAPVAGTIIARDYQAAGAGYYLTLRAVDGRDMFFAHCQTGSFTVALFQAVAAGQQICSVGSTGSSTGPHLHFEIWPSGWKAGAPVDPLTQLRAWAR